MGVKVVHIVDPEYIFNSVFFILYSIQKILLKIKILL